jgi:putative methionine-R-sulfoxide reductase with GAF domain
MAAHHTDKGGQVNEEISQADLEKLMAINTRLGADTDLVKKIHLIADTIRDILRVERCTIFVWDKNTRSFWTAYADEIGYIEIPDDRGIVSKVCQTKEMVVENDVQQSQNFFKKVDKSSGFQTRSMLAMPIIGFGGECIGVVQLLNKDNDFFSEKDIQVLQFVVNHFTAFVQSMVLEHL